jgi:hypothetical protein
MPVFTDLTGKKFARLKVNGVFRRGTPEGVEWSCTCDCGNRIITTTKKLNSGNTKSCGCYQKHRVKELNTTHGMKGTRQYTIWQGMKDRCFNTKNVHYDRYGGRGITVCQEWHSFEKFWEDMKDGYKDHLTIDRIDNDGIYEPRNCRWSTTEEQSCNTSQNHMETVDGYTDTISRLARKYGIGAKNVRRRISLGWDIERALKTPVKTKL